MHEVKALRELLRTNQASQASQRAVEYCRQSSTNGKLFVNDVVAGCLDGGADTATQLEPEESGALLAAVYGVSIPGPDGGEVGRWVLARLQQRFQAGPSAALVRMMARLIEQHGQQTHVMIQHVVSHMEIAYFSRLPGWTAVEADTVVRVFEDIGPALQQVQDGPPKLEQLAMAWTQCVVTGAGTTEARVACLHLLELKAVWQSPHF